MGGSYQKKFLGTQRSNQSRTRVKEQSVFVIEVLPNFEMSK